jgi:hypothetical protein
MKETLSITPSVIKGQEPLRFVGGPSGTTIRAAR